MIYFYRFIYFILQSILQILKPFLPLKTKSYIDLRHSKKYLDIDFKQALWFHASSGELEYCKSVITEVRKNRPHQKIVVSYSSPSAEKLLFNIENDVDFIFPLPWDSYTSIREVITHLKPIGVVFSRTDFWPELIFQLKKRHIPTMAIAMFPRFNIINNYIYCWLLIHFKLITCVNSKTAATLSKKLNRPVLNSGDTRFDQVFHRLSQPSRVLLPENTKRIVFASTWPEDERQIIPTFNKLVNLGYQIILCPHEVHRASDLKSKLAEYSPSLLSEVADTSHAPLKINQAVPLLIVDHVGLLADIYRFSEFAFVGGSFKSRVHSVMEPLCSNNIVFFGPYIQNNPEALESLEQQLTFQVHSTNDIVQFMENFIGNHHAELKMQIKNFTESNRGASQRITQEILTHIF